MVAGAVVSAVVLAASPRAQTTTSTTIVVPSTTTTNAEEAIPGTSELRRGDLDAAREKLVPYIATNPLDMDARYLLGLVEERAGDLDAAIAVYEEILAVDPRDFEARFHLGSIMRRAGELEQAIGEFEQALQLNGDFTAARVALAETLAMSGDVDRAIRLYFGVIEAQPMGVHFDQIRYHLALLLIQVGQPDNAALQLSKALVENPDNHDARALLEELLTPTPTTVPTTASST